MQIYEPPDALDRRAQAAIGLRVRDVLVWHDAGDHDIDLQRHDADRELTGDWPIAWARVVATEEPRALSPHALAHHQRPLPTRNPFGIFGPLRTPERRTYDRIDPRRHQRSLRAR
jgi:hypothetical protein